ncbi:hypothetical protein B0T22DRAFT_170894 [Podospora appendiculata]|uniref:SET domain-containing protein n=1 Tax=Podospora appendiculata TaxID=314037 RepID=A0AAE0XBF5_9PEZI|nr:hypothetical protein B0T22DRAFT_170894 [Podospora appendiculata]
MAYNAGFDMVPRLSTSLEDKKLWRKFINAIKEEFRDDTNFYVTGDYIEFDVGGRPKLPFEGHKFLSFSVSTGAGQADVGNGLYLAIVVRIAAEHFGMNRVQPWHEASGGRSYYGPAEVHESILSYSQIDEPSSTATTTPAPLSSTTTAPPLFQITTLPTKGRALVAQAAIRKGTRILSERPLFTLDGRDCHDVIGAIASKLKALRRPEQDRFLTLSNSKRSDASMHPFLGTYITNSLPCSRNPAGTAYYHHGAGAQPAEPDATGIFPTISLLNHSCVPNTCYSFNTRTRHGTVHALRAIPAGEELTIAYLDDDAPRADRRERLQFGFDFACACTACSLPAAQQAASDTRRKHIHVLRSSGVREKPPPRNSAAAATAADLFPLRTLHNCHMLIELLRQEYGEAARLSGVYDTALRTCLAHRDAARTGVFAWRVYEALAVELGEDSPLAQEMRDLAADPTGSQRWETTSADWRTTSEAVPGGSDIEEFERWLFRL